ncbi:chromosome segregation protein SMC [Anaeromassilibacillus senegalensis]|uniref:Chromosome partition protein Smc n=1 Tax=Anaeromassilibacillus senegalensis TaxID=1673717 RepID=A0ABS9CNL7_9FIRM|nr:chromosome segregation protein SMC [Anaeromassilibacillus senegalensis]MCF2651930.1 chromosome segregation protein SMC [Anaeromassilibacillus senegalensis]
MLLKSLELQGFKTFPDKTLLTFEKGITAVVGPNGSGKSNISDAMRWVLGEQSTRALRCSKMEDVIFSGTPQRKAQGFSEVTITIDNTDRRLNFDGDTVAITRRFYRSGESEYRINKTMVRLRDVHELFMDTGLGRDGYSIIGQGKIDSIVAAKSEDRREIFEEAAGISRYRYRKEEAERRLQKAEENLIRLRDILSELEGRVEPLRVQAEKAEKFIAFDAEKKKLEIGLWLETLNRSGRVVREAEEKISIAQSQYQEAEAALEKLAQEIERNFTETNGCTVQMETVRSEAAAADEDATRKEGEISVIENDIRHDAETVARLTAEIEEAAMSEKEIGREIAEKETAVKAKEAEIARHNSDFIAFTAELEALRSGTDSATKEIDAVSASLAELNAALAEARVRQTSAESSVQEIRSRADTVDSAIRESETRIAALEKEESELQTMLSDTLSRIQTAENAVRGYELRLESRRKKVEAAKAEADRLRLDANEQERRAKLLEDLERNLEGFTQSVKTVMRERERGNLQGIHGPVTRLLHVPREYAVALETALGAAMQNVVVDSEESAKAAIYLLKQRNSGRATFLPLNTIRGTALDKREFAGQPGFVGVASELCSCDAQYAGIRDSLLGRTVVAETLDSAAQIARKIRYRYRVVSLDGQVVNAGGSFTGGSAARNSGLLSRAGEIERIRKEAQKLHAAAQEAAGQFREAQQEAAHAAAQLDTARSELTMLGEDKIRFTAEAARAQRDVAAEKRSRQNFLEEKNNADGRIGALNDVIERAKDEAASLEEKACEARARMESMAGSRADQMQRCDEMARHLQELRLSGLAVQKDKETLEAAILALEARRGDRTDRVKLLESEIEACRAHTTERAAAIEALKAETQALRTAAEEKRGAVQQIAEKRASLEKRAGELRLEERETSAQRESIGLEVARLRERLQNLSREYDSIIAKLWEEYELTRREAEELGITVEDIPAARRRLTELKNKIKALGAVNVAAVVEYKEVSERYRFMKAQTDDVEKSKAELLKLIAELTRQMQTQFTERFAVINENFGKIFKDLFGGGSAQLLFTDESDILNSGIEIKVHPPGKIVSHIELLSGGEKALVAISIYFAIMRVSPPPFCVLDEIEAALDDVNVTRYANYLRRMNEHTQFIVITHRRGTMEEADVLYGVTMQDQGISKLLSLRTHEVEEKLGL